MSEGEGPPTAVMFEGNCSICVGVPSVLVEGESTNVDGYCSSDEGEVLTVTLFGMCGTGAVVDGMTLVDG